MNQPEALTHMLGGILAFHTACSEKGSEIESDRAAKASLPAPGTKGAWNGLGALADGDGGWYVSERALRSYIVGYLQLLCILPLDLLSSAQAEVCDATVRKDARNAFGLRSLGDGGCEYFGWGVWPAASLFNHSCAPNVGKRRVGRRWEFWSERDVRREEELCISYLGGEEWELGRADRVERMRETWGFECACGRCVREDRAL